MRKLLSKIPLAIFAVWLVSCAYNAKENLDPCAQYLTISCDTTTKYTYSGEIGVLMEDQGCNACHEDNVGDSPKLNTQADLIAYVTDCQKRAKFETAIQFTGAHPMPKGGPKMADADIQKFLAWICQGAKP